MDLLQGRNVSLSFDSSALSGLTNGLWFDAKRTDSLLLDLVADAASDGRSHTELGTLEPAQPGFGTMIGPINHDEAHEVERLRGQLVDKAGQLRKLPHTGKRRHPGIIVVDTSQDPQLMGRSGAIAAMLNEARRDWAADLACVILVASTWPGFALTIVVGPRYEPFAETSLPGLRKCARGHFHVDAFGRSPQDCQLDKYDNFAPLCAA